MDWNERHFKKGLTIKWHGVMLTAMGDVKPWKEEDCKHTVGICMFPLIKPLLPSLLSLIYLVGR